MMLLEKLSTAVVVETKELLHHRLYVGLHVFQFPMTAYSTTEGLPEHYGTFQHDHMHACTQQECTSATEDS